MTEFLNIEEAAHCLKLNKRRVQNMCSSGVLQRGVVWFQKPGALGKRFDPVALEAWVREGDGRKADMGGIPMRRGYVAR